MTLTPGNARASARPVRNSLSVSQRLFCTNSRIIHPLRPPPKLDRLILAKIKKISPKPGRLAVLGTETDVSPKTNPPQRNLAEPACNQLNLSRWPGDRGRPAA
jgi:hypothetical protein